MVGLEDRRPQAKAAVTRRNGEETLQILVAIRTILQCAFGRNWNSGDRCGNATRFYRIKYFRWWFIVIVVTLVCHKGRVD
jgi:hypothetical protein